MGTKKRRTFMIEPELLERLRSIKVRTGMSESEQIRQGIRWWLESREWPLRSALDTSQRIETPRGEATQPARRRRKGT